MARVQSPSPAPEIMRKRLKKKLCACAMCKPFKRGKANRWKHRELDGLERAEKDCRDAVLRV